MNSASPKYFVAAKNILLFCSLFALFGLHRAANAQTVGTTSFSAGGTGAVSGSTPGTSAQWLGWGPTNLNGGTAVNYTFSLANGYTLTLTISVNVTSSGGTTVTNQNTTIPTYSGARFGNVGYTGITGNVALYSTGVSNSTESVTGTIHITNIVLKNSLGQVVTTGWTFIESDVESTNLESDGIPETITGTTNGSNWRMIDSVSSGAGSTPTLSGTGSTSFTITGTGGGGAVDYLLGTTAPTSITAGYTSSGGRQGIGFAIIVPPIPEGSTAVVAVATGALGAIEVLRKRRKRKQLRAESLG